MKTFQTMLIILLGAKLILYAIKHNEPIPYKYNFYTRLFMTSILVFILYLGGFFK